MNVLKNTPYNLPQEQLVAALEDIVCNLEIRSDFCIYHPSYRTFELDAEVRFRFEQLPKELNNKYLGLRLRSFLYEAYYSGSIKAEQEPDDDTNSVLNLENNMHRGADVKFYGQLHNSNSGIGYFDAGWLVKTEEDDGSLAVIKDGLTLHLDRTKHLSVSEQSTMIGSMVSIRMPKNLIQPGYYIAVSNLGSSSDEVEIYFNVSPEGAVYLMQELTKSLNAAVIPFTLKALHNPSEYECYKPLILKFSRDSYEVIWEILQPIYTSFPAYFRHETPLFTKVLAPGLALAEEPKQKISDQEDFGQNRCQVIADGLMEARQEGDEAPEKRMNAILNHFSVHGISLEHPYLNADSEDIYIPLPDPAQP
jgi:hypothetical protein